VLNPQTPIGKLDVSVWGCLFGYLGDAPAYEPDFVAGATVSALSSESGSPASNVQDLDGDTFWKQELDKALAGTMTAENGASPGNMNDGNDATAWTAVIE